jgi:hypothetical protein
MEILSNEENSDIISWLPNGRGFVIHHKKRFSAELMPKYFKKSKFTSFTRKLNRWNFARVTRGPETGAYYHDYFQRDNLRLCMQMCCQSSKNPTSTNSASSMTASPLPQQQQQQQQQQQIAQLAQQQTLSQQIPPMMMLGAGVGAGLGQSMMMGQLSMGDAMTRLRLGETDMGGGGGGGGFGGVDLSTTTMGMLQNQLNSQLAAFGNNNASNNNIGNSNDDTLFQIRQLEHQRELLLQQHQQQQQLQRMQQQQQQLQQQQLQQQLQQQQQQQLQQQQQQQQLAAMGLSGGSNDIIAGAGNHSEMSLGALQRGNTNAYLAMLMAQEKLEAQMAAFGNSGGSVGAPASPAATSFTAMDFQRQQASLIQQQQQQLDQFNQQRMLQALQQQHQQQQQQNQQLDASCVPMPTTALGQRLGSTGVQGVGMWNNALIGVGPSGDASRVAMDGQQTTTSPSDGGGKIKKRGASAA